MDKILYLIKRIIPIRLFRACQPVYHFLMAWLAALLYGFPSEKLMVIGITGTTGKTTSVHMIARVLEANGIKTGFTSTAAFNNGNREWLNDKKMTMLGRMFIQKMLRDMARHDCRAAIVETTSEGIRQFRHRFINYDVAIFTGLYEEHIDSHGSFENYKQAKGRLFSHLGRCRTKYLDGKLKVVPPESSGLKKIENKRLKKTIIVNGDDEYAGFFLGFKADRKIMYSGNRESGLPAKNVETVIYGRIESDAKGTAFSIGSKSVCLHLLGAFNAVNAMNAYCAGLALDLRPDNIIHGLELIKGVAGRLEKIDSGQGFTIIVDYAFEPKAVSKLYETIKYLPHGRIIHVLGSAGGGRDIARRPVLGKLAGLNADTVIVTNEDPYDDDPETIIDQVGFGSEKEGKTLDKDLFKILDRRQAIAKALDLARPGDLVLITGKGSEQAICAAAGEKIPWDDRAVVRELLESRKQKAVK